MEVKLRVLNGKSAGQELVIPGPKFVIGRGEGCQLRPRSDAIAERQCELDIQPTTVTLNDLSGTGGTRVNGKPLSGPVALKTGDKLTVGPLEFEVLLKISIAAKKKPKVKDAGEAATRMAATKTPDKSDEMDVLEWLGEGPENSAAAARYAASLSKAERQRLGIEMPEEEEADASVIDTKVDEKPQDPGASKSSSGIHKAVARSPKDAAAEMLSRMRRRG